jgi:hypothetical protein
LAWLGAEEQRTRGTMTAGHEDLMHALDADTGSLSRSLANIVWPDGIIQRILADPTDVHS